MSPTCAQGAPIGTHMSSFVQPIACPLCSLARLVSKSAQGMCVLGGCHGRPYTKDKAIFSTLNECNTKQIFVGDDRSLSVVRSRIVHLNDGHINDVLCVSNLSCNLLLVYQTTHLGEDRTVEFSPHQVVIKYFKDLKHIIAIGIIDGITKLYTFDNFGLPSFYCS
jgi:hypothetical protein